MIALFRYAVVKSTREHLLAILLLAPLVLTCAPLLGVAVAAAFRGDASIYPLHAPEATPAGTSVVASAVTVVLSALVASVGAFWIFRREIATRAVNFFFLARHPRAVSGASTAYGLAAGTLAYGLARATIIILTASPPERPFRELTIAVLSALVGSTFGSLLVAISTEATILVLVYAGGLASIALLELPDFGRIVIAVVIAAVLAQLAPIVLRWRCAS